MADINLWVNPVPSNIVGGQGGTGSPVEVSGTVAVTGAGDATAAKQDTGNTSLASIDSKLPALSGGSVPVIGPLTDTQLRASAVPISNTNDGGKITAATMPAGGTGFMGWLSAIWYQLTQTLTTTISGSVAVTGTFWQTTQPVSYATTGSGTSTGALRVELPTNGTGVVGLNAGSNLIGKVQLSDGTNHASIKAASTAAAFTDLGQVVDIRPGGILPVSASAGDGSANPTTTTIRNMGHLWNGGSWDRQRGNIEVTLLASSARTTTQTSADIVNYNNVRLVVVLDVTSAGTGSITLSINGKDSASGKYYTILAGTAVTSNGTTRYRVGPDLASSANSIAQDYLPRVLQIVVTANNANSVTYSVGYCLVGS